MREQPSLPLPRRWEGNEGRGWAEHTPMRQLHRARAVPARGAGALVAAEARDAATGGQCVLAPLGAIWDLTS